MKCPGFASLAAATVANVSGCMPAIDKPKLGQARPSDDPVEVALANHWHGVHELGAMFDLAWEVVSADGTTRRIRQVGPTRLPAGSYTVRLRARCQPVGDCRVEVPADSTVEVRPLVPPPVRVRRFVRQEARAQEFSRAIVWPEGTKARTLPANTAVEVVRLWPKPDKDWTDLNEADRQRGCTRPAGRLIDARAADVVFKSGTFPLMNVEDLSEARVAEP